MDIGVLQEEIDNVSILFYQNREQEAFERIGELFEKLKIVTDALLQIEGEDREQILSYVSMMYRILYESYQQKDMLGMADGLQEYAVLATELYKTRC